MGAADEVQGRARTGLLRLGPGRVLLETDDLIVAETELSSLYGPVRLGSTSAALPIRVLRQEVGPVTHSAVRIGGELGYDAEPAGNWSILVLRDGVLEPRFGAADPQRITAGRVVAMELPELPRVGVVRRASWQSVSLPPETLARVDDRDRNGRAARPTGHDPVSPAAAARMIAAIEHFGVVAAAPTATPLLAGVAAEYLAAVVLDTFPCTGERGPTAADRNDAHPETVRRAVAYMESHAREDIALADIAAAAYVTIRGVQLAFRRHLGTTPVHYLRRIRLSGAHAELVAATPGSGRTVGAIAADWGFSNAGRFAIAYRHAYGCRPSVTLNR
ncbi:helix-turn-helix domain-containing protein [Nocardia sp. NPDC057227]|uniref:helix-turn-helix domain-containing protein n=1 Tax=Nocardia sp. NPDC057227 TaxID=3346056 RepID=UPI0036267834